MKLPFTAALAVAALAAAAYGDNNGPFVVQNPHGGYNTIQGSGPQASIPFFGFHGFASHAIAQSHEKPKFILQPAGVKDDGHGNKVVIYKKVYFATAEDAEAAKQKQ